MSRPPLAIWPSNGLSTERNLAPWTKGGFANFPCLVAGCLNWPSESVIFSKIDDFPHGSTLPHGPLHTQNKSQMKQSKIVITGGPSGGKTTLIEGLKKELGHQAAIVPEAASLLFRGGFPRSKSKDSVLYAQRAIFFVQRELEDLIQMENPKSPLIVCDRGSLDGLAYWPRSEEHFFRSLKTTRSKEIRRYDWILHLDTAGPTSYDTTNPIRTESYEEAARLNEKVRQAWKTHPRRFIIAQNEDFFSKMSLCLAVIRAIAEGWSEKQIRYELLSG